MELIINELSFYPLATSSQILETEFRLLLKSFSEARDRYNFTHISFPVHYPSIQVTETSTFLDWVSNLTSSTIKDLILGLCKRPFVDDLNEVESSAFFQYGYKIVDPEVPTESEPIGLPVAYIKELPSISLDSHHFWRRNKIRIYRIENEIILDDFFEVYNICQSTDLNCKELNEWANACFSKYINGHELINKYLNYKKYSVSYGGDFLHQFLEWKENDFENFKYLLQLMKDVEDHPFVGGMGQTENLLGRGKEASKRVTQPDRLSYILEKNNVHFLACKGHYEFH